LQEEQIQDSSKGDQNKLRVRTGASGKLGETGNHHVKRVTWSEKAG